jgi:hypothetical protein
MAMEHCGNRCNDCGYDDVTYTEVFDFHHINPSAKDFSPSGNGHTYSWAKVKEELGKCVMLCANCHRIRHAKIEAEKIKGFELNLMDL